MAVGGNDVRAMERADQRAHRWFNDSCAYCGLSRREVWVLDDEDRAVLALLWLSPRGTPIRAQPFPVFKGMRPKTPPRKRLDQAYPGITIGREPMCKIDRFR